MSKLGSFLVATLATSLLVGCSDEAVPSALVKIQNDFNNPAVDRKPPWTICHASYLGVDFGTIAIGETSTEKSVKPGLDYVLMVAAWADPTCSPDKSLPIASKTEEEVVDGQSRTIAIGLANHQGACPPEGIPPIPEAQYNRILQLWPDFGFKPYAERTQNAKCVP